MMGKWLSAFGLVMLVGGAAGLLSLALPELGSPLTSLIPVVLLSLGYREAAILYCLLTMIGTILLTRGIMVMRSLKRRVRRRR